jgi:hypothetical protein
VVVHFFACDKLGGLVGRPHNAGMPSVDTTAPPQILCRKYRKFGVLKKLDKMGFNWISPKGAVGVSGEFTMQEC